MQPKLLRVLESKTVRRIGEAQHRKVDVRFVSATHRDLQQLVGSRPSGWKPRSGGPLLPFGSPPRIRRPLRARPADIPLLVVHFLRAKAPGLTLPGALAS